MLRIPYSQQQPSVWQEQHCPSTISRMPSIQHSGAGPGSTHQQEHLAWRALSRSLRHPAGEAGQLELVHVLYSSHTSRSASCSAMVLGWSGCSTPRLLPTLNWQAASMAVTSTLRSSWLTMWSTRARTMVLLPVPACGGKVLVR